MSLRVKTVTWVGDGSAGLKTISGAGFAPKLFVGWSAETASWLNNAFYWIDTMPAGSAYDWYDNGDSGAISGLTKLSAFTSDGITINVGSTYKALNSSGVTYYGVFIGGDDIVTGHYTGDGTDNRAITGVGAQPEFVWIANNYQHCVFKTLASGASTDVCSYIVNLADISNGIQSLDADGFTVGSSVRTNDDTAGKKDYYWFAIKQSSAIKTVQYTGNATDNRNITTPSLDPLLALIKSTTTDVMVWRDYDMSGDVTKYAGGGAFSANNIQSFITGGVQVGTDTKVNGNTKTIVS